MISKSLLYIKEFLLARIEKLNPQDKWTVELDALNKDSQPGERDILITLLHIEEERASKSQEYYRKNGNGTIISNPEIIVNLYVLITSQKTPYATALKQISQVIGIFQAKNTFSKDEIGKEGINSLALDFYPLSLEQNNSLWQTLGSTLVPSVVYKVRTIAIQESSDEIEVYLIRPDGIFVNTHNLEKTKKP